MDKLASARAPEPNPAFPVRRQPARSLPALAAALIALVLSGPAFAQDVLVVVGDDVTLSATDTRVIAQLGLIGVTPTLVDDDVVVAGDATGRDLVYISASVSSGLVGNTFATTAVPVVVAEGFIYDDMNLTGGTFGSDFGITAGQTQLSVTGVHPLTAGLSGLVDISVTAHPILFGVGSPSVIVAATEAANASNQTIFAYETGAFMAAGVPAPARRVGIPIGTDVPLDWTADMKQLFNASIEWALGQPIISRTRILLLGDSITSGAGGFNSYRPDLSTALAAEGCAFDFVGNVYTDHGLSFDADHQGVNAFSTDLIEADLPTNLVGNRSDVALVFAGTVDVLNTRATVDIDTDLRDIVALLRANEPDIAIFLAQIIPNLPANDAAVTALNAAVAQIAVDLNTAQSPVIAVDHFTGYDPVTMTSANQIQPNALGDAFIANAWAQALLPVLGPVKCPGISTSVPAGDGVLRGVLALLLVMIGGSFAFARVRQGAH